jgi:hypothetical protein
MAMLASHRSAACAPTFRPLASLGRLCPWSCSSSASLIPLPLLSELAPALTVEGYTLCGEATNDSGTGTRIVATGSRIIFPVRWVIPLRVYSASSRQRPGHRLRLGPVPGQTSPPQTISPGPRSQGHYGRALL